MGLQWQEPVFAQRHSRRTLRTMALTASLLHPGVFLERSTKIQVFPSWETGVRLGSTWQGRGELPLASAQQKQQQKWWGKQRKKAKRKGTGNGMKEEIIKPVEPKQLQRRAEPS